MSKALTRVIENLEQEEILWQSVITHDSTI
jgi:hypothetical protein